MSSKVYLIEGNNFSDFAGLIDEFNRVYFCDTDYCWDGNLDAFNDFIHTTKTFTIRWLNSEKSRKDLGHEEMAAWLTRNLENCLTVNRPGLNLRLEEANSNRGMTFFEWFIDLIECRPGVDLDFPANLIP